MVELLASLGIAFALGLSIAAVYRFTHRGITYERSFLVTLVMIAPIVGLVMMLIGSNLALSLGLVGALSIIRFRNVIKDSRDMVFLFWGIAVGLGTGTFNWAVILLASGAIGAVLALLHVFDLGGARHAECVLVLNGRGQPDEGIGSVLSAHLHSYKLRRIDWRNDEWEAAYEVRFAHPDPQHQHSLVVALQERFAGIGISVFTPTVALPF
ncbi:MAG: DUF4956 domain-containing protein [Alphaproteobacteria bacterium]|nr:DUF4956 domain-containing protein [Alphaproteobacteria bacterium]